MPRARRNQPVETAPTEEIRQTDAPVTGDQPITESPAPAEAAEVPAQGEQPIGDTPAPTEAAETPAQGDQPTGDTPAPAEAAETPAQGDRPTGDTPAPAEAAETPAQAQQAQETYQLGLTVRIKDGDPSEDIVATADVDLGNICTIRNVKIKEDDYGLKVVMPRTKMPDTGRFKDACYFHSVDARVQFDRAVLQSYEQSQALQQESGQSAHEQESGGMGGMTM